MQEIENDYDFSMKKAYYELKHGITEDKFSVKSSRFASNAVALSGAAKNDITNSLTKSVAVASRMMAEYMLNANPNVQKAIIAILEVIDKILPTEKRFFMFSVKDFMDTEKLLEKSKSHSEFVHSVLAHEWPNEILKTMDSFLGVT